MKATFNFLNCLHLFRTKYKLESHKRVCKNKIFCNTVVPCEETKILELNQHQKSDNTPFIIYADLESLIEKTDRCKNNPKNSSLAKASDHIPSGFSVSATLPFKSIENEHDVQIVWKSFVNS